MKVNTIMEIRQLTGKDKDSFSHMNKLTTDTLADPSFLIPFSQEETDASFADGSKDIIYGIFNSGKLIAMSGIYFDVKDFIDEQKILGINLEEAAEIGGSMILAEHRGNGYMLRINSILIDIAKQQNIKYILATAHPNNIASNKSLSKLGMKLIKEFDRHGYRRNLYLFRINQD